MAILLVFVSITVFCQDADSLIISFIPEAESNVRMYREDDEHRIIGNLGNLKSWLDSKGETLVFAMNGGMFTREKAPQGLYIEDFMVLAVIDTSTAGYGNFYLHPNGIFYIDAGGRGVVCKTGDFKFGSHVKYATQSGPMLLFDGKINSNFTKGSSKTNIRNGVGILPDGRIIFAITKREVNMYDFASFFKSQGCRNALYLDGFVSRAYYPAKNVNQSGGALGVLIGVTK